MDYTKVASEVLTKVGGKSNVSELNHCITRLRFHLNDESKADTEAIKKIKGVSGVIQQSGQYQVVIGTEVDKVYAEMIKMCDGNSKSTNNQKNQKSSIMDIISGIFTPLLPALIGCGMIKAILAILILTPWVTDKSQTYIMLNLVSDTVFHFLPVLVAFTTAKKIGANPFLAAAIGAMLIHPDFVALVTAKKAVHVFGIPVTLVDYGSTVIPAILSVFIMKYVERFFNRISPKLIKTFLVPTLTIMVMVPVAFCGVGPIGTWLGDLLAMGMNVINHYAPWLLPMIIGAFSPLLVMVGMHYSLFPVSMPIFFATGVETFMMPGMFCSNVALGAATLAAAVKTKNSELKQTAVSTGVTAVLGVTEPALYGITLPLKKPLIATMIGGGIGGLMCGILNVGAYNMGSPGLAAFAMFIGGKGMTNFIFAMLAGVISMVVAFILTLVMGFEDNAEVQEDKVEETNTETESKVIEIMSPLEGKVIDIKEVSDPTFAEEMLGEGVAIVPDKGEVVSPVNGVVSTIFPSKHAIGITSDTGIELLIHIGFNTVSLDGKGFEAFVKDGDRVSVGDKLVNFDQAFIESQGLETTTVVVVTNMDEVKNIKKVKDQEVTVKNTIMMIE